MPQCNCRRQLHVVSDCRGMLTYKRPLLPLEEELQSYQALTVKEKGNVANVSTTTGNSGDITRLRMLLDILSRFPLYRVINLCGGLCGVVVRLLASHPGEPGSIPGGFAPRFLHGGIVPDDVAGRWVFSGISLFSRLCIPALLRTRLTSLSSVPKTSICAMFPQDGGWDKERNGSERSLGGGALKRHGGRHRKTFPYRKSIGSWVGEGCEPGGGGGREGGFRRSRDFGGAEKIRTNSRSGYRPVTSSLTSPSHNQLLFHSLPELTNPSHKYQFLPQHIPLPHRPHKHGLPAPLRSPPHLLKLLTVVSSSSKHPLT
ncbi:hypothetical protein PR048_019245 [Dryococelus australis]|uniref:Uncharacterized protein n=1 Tax=Dryococelus australis TaxID=614101 RepID=A0ABQ9H323_9NEOP|nr:hypothetical protein PR048_019245 [Dryococelus australis]